MLLNDVISISGVVNDLFSDSGVTDWLVMRSNELDATASESNGSDVALSDTIETDAPDCVTPNGNDSIPRAFIGGVSNEELLTGKVVVLPVTFCQIISEPDVLN